MAKLVDALVLGTSVERHTSSTLVLGTISFLKAMQIDFVVKGLPISFHRDSFTGNAELRSVHGTISLQSPLNPLTHISFSLKKAWSVNVEGSNVVIEKVRPLLLAGFRPSKYKIFVNGEVQAEAEG